VSFSGDKLLGGPQSGLVVGSKELIDRLRKHPLYRAIRVDKLICAALEATLGAYAKDTAKAEIPVLNMLSMSAEKMNERARSFKTRSESEPGIRPEMKMEIISGNSAVGGGAAPDVSPETTLISLTHEIHSDNQLERLLRTSDPPVIARIVDNKVLIDLRTVSEDEETELIKILRSIN
jgi:L-seryl-tRNA(Ser) seleniumtransferase